MSSSRRASPNPVGLWFCHTSSGLQARWHIGGASESDPQQDARNAARGADTTQAAKAPGLDAAGTKDVPVAPRRTAAATTCRREAMPEATVYLLLDRCAPS